MYLHPQGIPKELPDIINASAKILPYLDVPFQHVSPKVLRAMGRPGKKHGARDLVVKLRKAIPDLTLRTTLMVGFPGEGEADFQELMDFVEECSPEHLGIFPYSPEEAAPAFELGDPIPAAVKRIRMKKLTSSASKLRRKKALSRMGSLQNCIVEGLSQETDLLLQGRLWDQAPEIDGTLYITEGQARVGEIRTVRLTKTHATDYFGELV
jgi:ribosomal protein S12 methylthiotransferase